MLIACHLFFGAAAGLLLQNRFKSWYILPACILGSVLPDLIDKPLGYIIFPSIGDGRLIAHSLIGLTIILLITAALFRDRFLIFALGIGILTHQILDEMWKIPVNWFYPLLGPFPVYQMENYFGWGFIRELTTPSEYLFALGVLFLLINRSQNSLIRERAGILSGASALLLLCTGR
ncbi:MAG TPA: metal-dependent hydrolase [Methanospirillum sp.]|uniref:metal-dependent hydrolase n=1 Tax=Methanospirillum sp. TaxID=45200 RepID=UPI002CB56BE0|nr:metal-dependent hydrolase [Methanospirillum sp.]HWQ63259.1 metal-dependent hydrolase [Methanospirillum sp.]